MFQKQKSTAILTGDLITAAAFGEPSRLNDICLGFTPQWLGGSRSVGIIAGATPDTVDALDYVDLEIDGTVQAGFTYRVRCEVLTTNAGTSIQPVLYDSTNPASLVLVTTTGGSASTSTSWARQTLTITSLAAAVKNYRLRFLVQNPSNQVFGLGYMERIVL
jgi:hypothetical protein